MFLLAVKKEEICQIKLQENAAERRKICEVAVKTIHWSLYRVHPHLSFVLSAAFKSKHLLHYKHLLFCSLGNCLFLVTKLQIDSSQNIKPDLACY